ncbi:MAG TPA: CusA/CzcA family heavy metal efflux RND transporter [Tepidisphaeraceae bacterium]|jgi:cobalt-zinc-cadmium resistance protein CzcA|nr:CusA/CzcA family heavy metal efflux RND transporter [Tepidisphaeraceae bacterium]
MLERVLHYSIQHRRLIVLLAACSGVLGFFSLRRLPIDAVPDITNNQVQINTLALSLSPAEIEKQVTFPVETALAGIPGLQYTRSLSRNGFSQVTAIFADDVDVYYARNQIDQRLRVARQNLPAGADPNMGPVTTGLGEVYMWAVDYGHHGGNGATVGDGKPGWQSNGSYLTPEGQRLTTDVQRAAYLRTVQDWIIRPQLKQTDGVADIDSLGGYEKQYAVQPDPMKLVSYGLTFSDVIGALERNNSSRGAGYIEHHGESYPVQIAGLLETPEQIAQVKIADHGGTVVRVGDVAAVSIGSELRMGAASMNGREVVVGTAMMLIGANSRTVAAAVDANMAEVNRTLPPDVYATTVYNRTKLVDSTILTVSKNLGEGALLVIVILFLLLGNLRAALITALAIPLSMLITAVGMAQSKISGNLMSLGAIDFGIIVDGSVIIVENCLRMLAGRQQQLRRKLTPAERLETVFQASRQVRSATAFGEAIIITVYLPILTLTGVEGKMFRPMALTVIFALAAAFVLSLTFVPAMVALGIGARVRESENLLVHWAKRLYSPLLRFAVRRRLAVVSLAVLAFAASLLLFNRLGQEFIPPLDEQDIDIQTARIPSTGLSAALLTQQDIEQTVDRFPQVAMVFSKIGTAEIAADPMPPGKADTYVILKPRAQWPDPHLPKNELIEQIGKKLAGVPGASLEFTQPIQDRFNDLLAGTKGDIAVKVFGDDFDAMKKPAQEIARILKAIPGAQDVTVDQTEGLPLMKITPDPAMLGRYGLDVTDVQDVVATAVGGREAGVVQEGDRKFSLVVRLPETIRQDLRALQSLPIPLRPSRPADGGDPAASASNVPSGPQAAGAGFAFVPLSAVARVEVAEGLNEITREDGKRRVTVACNVRGRDIGSFVSEAQGKVAQQVKVPPGNWIVWGGEFENLIAARSRLTLVVPACFLLIFLLLYATFNSAKYALMVFSGVPLALTGGIVALWMRGIPFSISAAVGFIALSGVAVLNGLVMVTFINQLRGEGVPLDEAVIRGPLTRLRPVLMTALVASLGFVPMALATGTGAEVQRPLATVVIGGILSSTILTLLVLPALYRLWHRKEGAETMAATDVAALASSPA